MAEDVVVDKDTVNCALKLLVNLGNVLLSNAKKEKEASLQHFVPHKITTLFGITTAGADLYNSLGVKTKSEAEAVWKKYYQDEEVRERIEELLQLETEWDDFLLQLDQELQTTDTRLRGASTADHLDASTPFTHGRSGEEVTLGQYLGKGQDLLLVLIRHLAWLPWRDHLAELAANQAALDARSVRVLVVSYGSVEGAQLWLDQTGCKYDLLLDPTKKVYTGFGLGSSYAKVIQFGGMLRYSEYVAAGRDFPDVPHALNGDIFQMGGDFVLDKEGKVLLAHACKTPLDRPSVTEILKACSSNP